MSTPHVNAEQTAYSSDINLLRKYVHIIIDKFKYDGPRAFE